MIDTSTEAPVVDPAHLMKVHAHVADLLAATEDAEADLCRLRSEEAHVNSAEIVAAEDEAGTAFGRLRRAEAQCDVVDILAAEEAEKADE